MPRFPTPSVLVKAGVLTASVALAVASWFAPWSRPAPGTGSAGFYPATASPWGDFEYVVRYASQSPESAPTPTIFGALLFGPPTLLMVGAVATLFAVHVWARAVTTAVVVLASVVGLFFTAIFAFASIMYGHVLSYGAALALVGYVASLTLCFFLPRRPAPSTDAALAG